MVEPPLRLLLDSAALVANWRALSRASGGAACGAAVKADGYGLGALEVVTRLAVAGCRDFFVATWMEAEALGILSGDIRLSVLHGVREEDMATAVVSPARPVLNSAAQVARWQAAGGGACDVMVDTGMSRLGLTPSEALSGLLDGLAIETLMSHLACADEPDHPMNARQRTAFAEVAARVPAKRRSLANSAGIALGEAYHFDMTRPGLALYGGLPGPGGQVVQPTAQILQLREVQVGESVGYGASWVAERPTRAAILNLGYADGYLRGFSNRGDVLGRVSMDLIAVRAPQGAQEGDWIDIPYDLAEASSASGLSQYELLSGLGRRYGRCWS